MCFCSETCLARRGVFHKGLFHPQQVLGTGSVVSLIACDSLLVAAIVLTLLLSSPFTTGLSCSLPCCSYCGGEGAAC